LHVRCIDPSLLRDSCVYTYELTNLSTPRDTSRKQITMRFLRSFAIVLALAGATTLAIGVKNAPPAHAAGPHQVVFVTIAPCSDPETPNLRNADFDGDPNEQYNELKQVARDDSDPTTKVRYYPVHDGETVQLQVLPGHTYDLYWLIADVVPEQLFLVSPPEGITQNICKGASDANAATQSPSVSVDYVGKCADVGGLILWVAVENNSNRDILAVAAVDGKSGRIVSVPGNHDLVIHPGQTGLIFHYIPAVHETARLVVPILGLSQPLKTEFSIPYTCRGVR